MSTNMMFLQLLIRVVPHMDQMDRVLPYLAELGALHQRHGVAKQHIDLLGLAFCAAIRGVVQVRQNIFFISTKLFPREAG